MDSLRRARLATLQRSMVVCHANRLEPVVFLLGDDGAGNVDEGATMSDGSGIQQSVDGGIEREVGQGRPRGPENPGLENLSTPQKFNTETNLATMRAESELQKADALNEPAYKTDIQSSKEYTDLKNAVSNLDNVTSKAGKEQASLWEQTRSNIKAALNPFAFTSASTEKTIAEIQVATATSALRLKNAEAALDMALDKKTQLTMVITDVVDQDSASFATMSDSDLAQQFGESGIDTDSARAIREYAIAKRADELTQRQSTEKLDNAEISNWFNKSPTPDEMSRLRRRAGITDTLDMRDELSPPVERPDAPLDVENEKFAATKEQNDASEKERYTFVAKALFYLALLTGVAWFVYEVFQVVMADGSGCFVGGVKLPKSECPVPLQHPLGSEFFTASTWGLECPTCPPMWMCLMPANPVPRDRPCTAPPATCCPGVPPSSISGAPMCGGVSSTDAMNLTRGNQTSAPLPPGSSFDTTCSSPRACSAQGGCWIMHKPICKQYPNACKDPNDCKSTHGLSWGNGWGCVVKGASAGMSCAKSASECQQVCQRQNLPSSDCVWGQSSQKTMSSIAAVGKIGDDIAKLPGKILCDMLGGCGNIMWAVIIIAGVIILFIILRVLFVRYRRQSTVQIATGTK